jgi:transcriptional regulator with XRE-family HTH domain
MPPTQTVPYDGKKIRELRERKGLSIKELADAIGRHPESIRNLENPNKDKPASRVMLAWIAKALDADLDDFAPDELADGKRQAS